MTPTKVSQDSHIIVICYASTLKTKQILGEILQFNSQAPATHALSFLHTYLVSFSILIYTLQGGIYFTWEDFAEILFLSRSQDVCSSTYPV